MAFSALNKIVDEFKEIPHDFRASTQIFASLNVDKIARDLVLLTAGEKRGSNELPDSNEKSFDTIEHKIIERIEDEKKSAQATVEDELQSYSERLSGLDFKGQFERLKTANATSISDFKAEVQLGIDELHKYRDVLNDASNERKAFRIEHEITRAARVPTSLSLALKIALIILIVGIETWVNGLFLAEGSTQGLIGGVGRAFAYAAINIGVALLLGVPYPRR